jgi:diacylglycerol kinase (ATP)
MTQPTPWMVDRRVTVIVNPAAHNALKQRQSDEIRGWLHAEGWRVQWVETEAAGEATAIAGRAAEAGVPLILVCGGDGTLNETTNGLVGTGTTVGIIPTGTVNLWARELSIKRKQPWVAVQQAMYGERRLIDLGRAGSRYFLSMAGYGIDAAVTAGVSRRLKGRLGAPAYAISSAREVLRYRGANLAVDVDGEVLRLHALMIVASNTREYAGITQITPEAIADDGLLDVRVFEGKGRAAIAWHAVRVLLRLHRRAGKVHYRRVRRLTMQGEPALPLQLDGDASPDSPTEVEVVPGALWVTVPRDLTSPLFSRPPE